MEKPEKKMYRISKRLYMGYHSHLLKYHLDPGPEKHRHYNNIPCCHVSHLTIYKIHHIPHFERCSLNLDAISQHEKLNIPRS